MRKAGFTLAARIRMAARSTVEHSTIQHPSAANGGSAPRPPAPADRRQRDRLAATLALARRLPAYRDTLGVLPEAADPFETLSLLPVIGREQIQERPQDFRPPDRRSLTLSSSGSTGTPLELFIDPGSRRRRRRQFATFFLRNGWRPWHRAISLKLPYDPSARFGSEALDRGPLRRRQCISILDPVDEQYRRIRDIEPQILHGLPTILTEIATLAAHDGWRPPRLRRVFTVSETLRPGDRRQIESAFGAPVFDLYAAAEAFIGWECDQRRGFHLNESAVVTEILDEQGAPAPPGAVGSVVITTLDNPAMPLVRYAIGDMAIAGNGRPCPCGGPGALLPAVIGRRVPVFVVAGEQVSPWGAVARIAELDFVRQFQLVQPELGRLDVRVRWRPGRAVDERMLRRIVGEELGPGLSIGVVEVAELPPLPSGKAAEPIVSPVFPDASAIPEPSA